MVAENLEHDASLLHSMRNFLDLMMFAEHGSQVASTDRERVIHQWTLHTQRQKQTATLVVADL